MGSEFLQPPGWAAPKGYSNGVSARGRQIYLAGQIGWNESQQLVSTRFALQVRQALLSPLIFCSINVLPMRTWYDLRCSVKKLLPV